MVTTHRYEVSLRWTGNQGTGTSSYRTYSRDHELFGGATGAMVHAPPADQGAVAKPVILGSSDPAFRGDPARWNPEELLVASLAQCHMLWYLHLVTTVGVVVTDYVDAPFGVMVEDGSGAGHFERVVLRPTVTVAEASMIEAARAAHHRVGEFCFIARSVNFPVDHEPTVRSTS